MEISWHGHSCIHITTKGGHRLIIDPFISGNETSDLNIDTLEVDYILLTHGHNDHVGDTVALANKNNAKVIGMVELADYFETLGLKTEGQNIGGRVEYPFGSVKLVPAWHSSSYTTDEGVIPMGLAAGLVLEIDRKVIYHAGDTALYTDMKLTGEMYDIDLAFLPIGDRFTMGPKEASIAVKWLKVKKSVPIHYNTFPLILQDPQDFVALLPESVGIVPKIGENIEI